MVEDNYQHAIHSHPGHQKVTKSDLSDNVVVSFASNWPVNCLN